MPIKKVSTEHSLRKGFHFGKALNTISEQVENSIQGVPNKMTAKISFTKYFLENLDYKV